MGSGPPVAREEVPRAWNEVWAAGWASSFSCFPFLPFPSYKQEHLFYPPLPGISFLGDLKTTSLFAFTTVCEMGEGGENAEYEAAPSLEKEKNQ